MNITKNLIYLGICVQLIVFVSATGCSYSLYDEFLPLQSIQSSDVKNLCAKQYKAFSVENIVGPNKVNLENIKAISSYDGSKRQISWKQLTQSVKDEKIKISLTYTASIKKSLSTSKYNVTTSLEFVTLNFDKTFDVKTGVPQISTVSSAFAATDFKNTFSPNPNSADSKLLAEAIVNVNGPSLYASLFKMFANFQEYMQENCKNERLSKQYPNGIYYYTYQKDVAVFDMEANGISVENKTIHLGYNGVIKGTNPESCPEQRIAQLSNYHSFISKEFMENFLDYATKNFKQFLQVRINNETTKPVVFHFRLISLESVVPNAVSHYKDYELQPVSFTCHAQHLDYFHLGDLNNPTFADILWRCEGYLEVSGQSAKILDFEPEIRHFVRFQIENDEMGVFVHQAILNKVSFNTVDDFQVTGQRQAQLFINDVLGDMTTWTVGTEFKVRQGLNEIKYADGGIWLTSPLGINRQTLIE